MKIRIWDALSVFAESNEVSLRLSSYDPNYYLPSIALLTITINTPPVNSKLIVFPIRGDALSTIFNI
jgi:hypothetical protein